MKHSVLIPLVVLLSCSGRSDSSGQAPSPVDSLDIPQEGAILAAPLDSFGVNDSIRNPLEQSSPVHNFVNEYIERNTYLQFLKKRLFLSVTIVCAILLPALVNATKWIVWILLGIVVGIFGALYAAFQFIAIFSDIIGMSLLKGAEFIRYQWSHLPGLSLVTRRKKKSRRTAWKEAVRNAENYEEFLTIPLIDKTPESKPEEETNRRNPRHPFHECPFKDDQIDPDHVALQLLSTTSRLQALRKKAQLEGDLSDLKFLLTQVVKRNHLSLESLLIDDARSILDSGRCQLPAKARNAMSGFMDEVKECLDYIAKFPLDGMSDVEKASELSGNIEIMAKMKVNTGTSALMLSGGGALAMYHLGTIKALIDGGVYKQMKVISGASGGSIVAAMCAIKTQDELVRDVCVPQVSTDYDNTGKMRRENIRWFPSTWEMATYWLKQGSLVDPTQFQRCCDFYYGDMTFAEAYRHTSKHVCISVSASRSGARSGGAQRLLLNHISTPNVTISSAVAASCALPGVMHPAKLMQKRKNGIQEPFEIDGAEWIDGSIQADLPFKRIATLFNVSNFIACQVNFHIVPLLNQPRHPNVSSFYWRLFQFFEWDFRGRALNLGRLGLMPSFFGQDITKVFKQKYHGNITISPKLTTMQKIGLAALANPSEEDMRMYLRRGQEATWPYIRSIKYTMCLEQSLESNLRCLQNRFRSLPSASQLVEIPDPSSDIVSSTKEHDIESRFSTSRRASEVLLQRVRCLEEENTNLRTELEKAKKQDSPEKAE